MKLAELDISAIWHALGGGQLRGKRGQAFWRRGDGWNITLDLERRAWYDHRDGRGGGVLELVVVGLRCDRRSALKWLEENAGLDSRQSESVGNWRRTRQERADAEVFGIAALALTEEVLEHLNSSDLRREIYAGLRTIVLTGGSPLVEEYRAWRDAYPELTAAIVWAGAESRVRIQRRLAFYLLEAANVA